MAKIPTLHGVHPVRTTALAASPASFALFPGFVDTPPVGELWQVSLSAWHSGLSFNGVDPSVAEVGVILAKDDTKDTTFYKITTAHTRFAPFTLSFPVGAAQWRNVRFEIIGAGSATFYYQISFTLIGQATS